MAFKKKIKDIRGIHAAAVKNVIFKEFGVQLPINNKRNLNIIFEWKELVKAITNYMIKIRMQ